MPARISSRIESLARTFAAQVEREVRAEVARQVEQQLRSGGRGALRLAKGGSLRKRGKTFDMECPVQGCKGQSRGPRYNFFCKDHYDSMTVADRKKTITEAKARRAASKK